jgi:hypothetical protein
MLCTSSPTWQHEAAQGIQQVPQSINNQGMIDAGHVQPVTQQADIASMQRCCHTSGAAFLHRTHRCPQIVCICDC